MFLIDISKHLDGEKLERLRFGMFHVIEAYREEIEAKKTKPCALVLTLPVKPGSRGDPERP